VIKHKSKQVIGLRQRMCVARPALCIAVHCHQGGCCTGDGYHNLDWMTTRAWRVPL